MLGRASIRISRRSDRLRPKPKARDEDVFINVPFDVEYREMYVALVAGLVGLGFRPRGVLEIPPNKDRLARLREVIGECGSSVHDLSRVELSLCRWLAMLRAFAAMRCGGEDAIHEESRGHHEGGHDRGEEAEVVSSSRAPRTFV